MSDAQERVTHLLGELRKSFPQPRYELDFETPVQLLVASILAGGASDEAANRVTRVLFPNLPDAQAFLDADSGVLEEAIKPVGMTKVKAKWIKDACRILLEHHGGTVPKDMDALLQLPGVGRKTANVVLQTAYGMVTGIIVDTHVSRLAPRIGLTAPDVAADAESDDDDDDDDDAPKKRRKKKKKSSEDIEAELMQIVPRDQWTFFGPALVLHGRRVCTAKNPKCGECGVRPVCARNGLD
jgi:endonuclease-3